MARLILLLLLFISNPAFAFKTEVEIVFPYRDIKSGIVLGIDDKTENMLYPVHVYNDKRHNQVGFFKKPKSELSKYIERSLPAIRRDLLDKKENFIAPHSYAVKVNGQFLKPESKFFSDLIIKIENAANDGNWKGIKFEKYAYNKKTKEMTRETYNDGKLVKKSKEKLLAMCNPTATSYLFCESEYGILKFLPPKN